MAKLVDAQDLGSCVHWTWEFEPPLWHMQFSSTVVKHYAIKIASICISLWGIVGIIKQSLVLPKLIELINQSTLNFSSDVYKKSLIFLLITASINFILTAYGVALLTKPSSLVKIGHIILGILIIILSSYLSQYTNLDVIFDSSV